MKSLNMSDKVRLVIIRHGNCDNCGLSNYGRNEIEELSFTLQENKISPDIIITSPTERTKQTTSILSASFNNSAQIIEKDLFFYQSDSPSEIKQFLSEIPKNKKSIFVSGHAETVNSFTYHTLNHRDCAKLLSMIEEDKYSEYLSGAKNSLITSASTGDALILETDKTENLADAEWNLFGYIKNGKTYLASDINYTPNLPGHKKHLNVDFPILIYNFVA